VDVGVRRCRQMSSEWQAVGRFQRSSNRRERYKYYQRPSASQGSFLYTEYPRRAVTIINRRPAVTYSMRFMKRLTCARQQEVVALAPRIYWRFEFSSIRRCSFSAQQRGYMAIEWFNEPDLRDTDGHKAHELHNNYLCQ